MRTTRAGADSTGTADAVPVLLSDADGGDRGPGAEGRGTEKALRVLAMGPVPPPFHGVATFLRDLLANPPAGLEISHLDTSDRRDASNLGRWDPTNLQVGFSNLAELGIRCLRERPDVVYLPLSQNVPAFLRDALFVLQAKMLGARVAIHLHGGHFRKLYESSGAAFRWIARRILARVDAAIVLSEEFRPIFAGLVADARIHVVENGVPDFPEDCRARIALDPPTVLFMSTLARTKGIFELIQAIRILREVLPNIRLRVAGKWSEMDLREEVLAFIERERINSCIEFVGNVDGRAKAEFLASGDVFCLPTRYPYEGQPLVLLEAMAAGLPILSTRHGAIRSTVKEGCGLLLNANASPSEVAVALKEWIQDPTALRHAAVASRHRYNNLYSVAICHEALRIALTHVHLQR